MGYDEDAEGIGMLLRTGIKLIFIKWIDSESGKSGSRSSGLHEAIGEEGI